MRCWVPLAASVGVWWTWFAFMARANSDGYTLYRLDLSGDGYCGVNATRYTPDLRAPLRVPTARAGAGGNLTAGPPLPAGFDNFGCTGGVPAGYDYSRMLGDLGVVGLLLDLAIIEVGRARLLTPSTAFSHIP